MIELQDLKGFSIKEIQKIILSEEKDIEINVPKSSQMYFSTNDDIAMDYAQAAFAGQKLKEISEQFSYEEVPPANHESILFTIKGIDPKKLSDVLMDLSFYYGVNDSGDELGEEFSYMDIDQFLSDVNDGKIIAACPYFIEIANEFFKGEDKEERGEA